jgi:imidazoleglycerol-phosphate dehydratase
MRKATIARNTTETKITATVNVDGSGKAKVDTGIGFLDHMLQLFAFWGFFDLDIKAKGDLKVDAHHTNEDIGLVLGQAFKKALGDKKGIRRVGFASVPMEEVTAHAAIDISGRGSLAFGSCCRGALKSAAQEGYKIEYAQHFFDSFAKQSGINLNISIENPGRDLHATLEPAFKALGIALDMATQKDPRRKGVPSTKGVID